MTVPTFTLIVEIDPTEAIGDCSAFVDLDGRAHLVVPHLLVSPERVGRVVLALLESMQGGES